MSDFFTKKQKKWWCDHCKKFIEYTNISIDQHKRSKNHQRMVNQNLIYENRKAKAKKLMESTGGVDPSTYSHIQHIEKEALRSFNSNDSQRFNSNESLIQFKGNTKKMLGGGIMSHRETYNMSNNLLEEIKLEKLQAEHQELYGKNYLKKKKNREWGVFFDDTTKRPYYYNFHSRVSQWEKPENYDGPEEKEPQEEENPTEKGIETEEKPEENSDGNVGLIGKWQDVDPKESFFEKFKSKESEIKENFYSEVDFIRNNNPGDEEYDDDEEEEEEDENKVQYNKGTIDDYIIGNVDNNSFIPNLANEEIIDINEKLRKRDYDLKFVNQSFTKEEKNINNINTKIADEIKEGQTISFNLKTKKEDVTKKVKKPLFFDSD